MKKFLLSLAVLALGATAMNAEQYTIFSADNCESLEWTGDGKGFTTTVTVDGKTFTITSAKGSYTNNLVKPGNEIRVYKGSDITISSDDFEFTKVVLTATESKYGGEQTVSEGWAQTCDNLVLTLTTETPANTVTMSATANQYRVSNIVVSDTPATNPYVYLVGNQAGWKEPSAANQAIYDNWRLYDYDGDGVYTATYIIPSLSDGAMYFRVYPELTGWGSTPYAASSVSSENVELVLGTPVDYVEGEGCWTFKTDGSAYIFTLNTNTGTMTVSELTKANSVKETIALEDKAQFFVNYELTVGFVNSSNAYACDAAGDFIQLYGNNSLKVGDVIPAGWLATYALYSKTTPEIIDFTLPEVTEGTFVAKEVAAADITTDLVNSVVVVKDVVFAEATPSTKANFTGKVGDVELSFRNNYTIASEAAGTYDVTVVVTVFNNAPSLYVISYKASDTSGIEAIEAETAAPVYYNLQGVEVANPENGIFIVRRGNKVSKEIIR